MNGIEYMTSTSRQGNSLIKAKLVINADADRAMTEVLAKVQQVKYSAAGERFRSGDLEDHRRIVPPSNTSPSPAIT